MAFALLPAQMVPSAFGEHPPTTHTTELSPPLLNTPHKLEITIKKYTQKHDQIEEGCEISSGVFLFYESWKALGNSEGSKK